MFIKFLIIVVKSNVHVTIKKYQRQLHLLLFQQIVYYKVDNEEKIQMKLSGKKKY